MATTETAPKFKAQEVAFRTARGDWKRRIIKTAKAFEKFAAEMEDLGREWHARNSEWD
jgi:hypothetical protein